MVQKIFQPAFGWASTQKLVKKHSCCFLYNVPFFYTSFFLIFFYFLFLPLISPFEPINIAGRLLKRASVCGRFRSCTTLGPVLHSRPNHGTPSLYPTRPKHYVLHNGMNQAQPGSNFWIGTRLVKTYESRIPPSPNLSNVIISFDKFDQY